MRTTITIDDELIKYLMHISKSKNKSAVIRNAIQEWVKKTKIEELKNLSGKVSFSHDYKELNSAGLKRFLSF